MLCYSAQKKILLFGNLDGIAVQKVVLEYG